MRCRGAVLLAVTAPTLAWLAACGAFGSASDSAPADASTPEASTEGGATADAASGDSSTDGGTVACSKLAFSDTFTMQPVSNGWELVGGGAFTIVSTAGTVPRQAMVGTIDLTMAGQEAYAQRYIAVNAPTSVRLRYGYGVGSNTEGAAYVGCRLDFEGSSSKTGLHFHHYNLSAKVKFGSPTKEVDAFDYDLGTDVLAVTWHDVDLRVDIAGGMGTVTLAGVDTSALGPVPIPSDVNKLRLRCGVGQVDYGSGTIGVAISPLELDVCP